jgi:glutathione S-transferase
MHAVSADNFNPEYLQINPMGTVPSLIAPSLDSPLTDSRTILEYLDKSKGPSLAPLDDRSKATMQAIIDLVHSDDVGTNLILLRARDPGEYQNKRTGPFGAFIATRQRKLEYLHSENPDHSFYGPKSKENGMLHRLYITDLSDEHQAFFRETHEGYVKFAREMDRLETLLVLPYATGEQVTLADLHAVPWLAHAMAFVDTKEIGDLSKLEAHIQKSVPNFRIGPKLHKWWENYTSRAAFKEIYPELH